MSKKKYLYSKVMRRYLRVLTLTTEYIIQNKVFFKDLIKGFFNMVKCKDGSYIGFLCSF